VFATAAGAMGWCLPANTRSRGEEASAGPVLLVRLQFLWLWAENIPGPRATGHEDIFLSSYFFSERPGRAQPNSQLL